MRRLLGLCLFVTSSLFVVSAHATEKTPAQLQDSLSSMFRLAARPLIAGQAFEKRWISYVDKTTGADHDYLYQWKNFSSDLKDAVDVSVDNDWDYCTTQKFPWFFTPGQATLLSHLVHGTEKRCLKFRPEFYDNNREIVAEANSQRFFTSLKRGHIYHVLPKLMLDKTSQVFLAKREAIVGSALKTALPILTRLALDRSLTPVETSTAVALKRLIEQTDPAADMSQMEDRLKALLYSVNDWIADTGGNSNVYRDIDLERVLNERIDMVQEQIGRLLAQHADLAARVNSIERREAFSSIALLGLGFAGYKILNPL